MSARIALRKQRSQIGDLSPGEVENANLLKTNSYTKAPVLDNETLLYMKIAEELGPRSGIINVYNNWVKRNIPLQLEARKIESREGTITLSNVRVQPRLENKDESDFALSPGYCRDNALTYNMSIIGDATFEPKVPSIPSPVAGRQTQQQQANKANNNHTTISLGEVPIMLRSESCVLHGLTEGQRLSLGECTNDFGGYFIIDGSERSIISQEGLRTGIFMMWVDDATGKVETRITCAMNHGTSIVKMLPGTKWDVLKVWIHYLGKDKYLPLYVAFAFLGYNEDNATDLMNHFIPLNMRIPVIMYLQSSLIAGRSVGSDIVKYVIAKKGRQKNSTRSQIEEQQEVTKAVRKDLFPHIRTLNGKARALAFMAAQTMMYLMGERPVDNRDAQGIKKISTPGKKMEVKLNTIWTKVIETAAENASKVSGRSLGVASLTGSLAGSNQQDNEVTSEFHRFFMGASTSKGGIIMESVTDSLKRDTPAATISQITRLSAPTSRKGKKSSHREVNQSQVGAICVAETPEGENCGLVKNLASSCYISLDTLPTNFFRVMHYTSTTLPYRNGETRPFNWSECVYVLNTEDPETRDLLGVTDYTEIKVDTAQLEGETDADYETRLHLIREEEIQKRFPYPVFINGVLSAWCVGPKLEEALKICRNFGLVPIDSCIFFNSVSRSLEIDTTGDRCIRPMLLVEDGRLVIDDIGGWKLPLKELLTNGCMAFVDSREQEKIMCAQTTAEVRQLPELIAQLQEDIEQLEQSIAENESKDKDVELNADRIKLDKMQADLEEITSYPYSHCDIHPLSQYGNLAGMIPAPNRTQGPRITYQASMGKQALNQYHTSHHIRYDKSFKIMTKPSIPMFQTALSDVNKLNVMPAGDNIIKAIYAHPDNPEDGIVANENMIKSGKFRINKYTTHKLVIKRKNGGKSDPDKPDEVLAKPPLMPAGNERFHALDESGLPIIGTYVKKGDCIIGRMRVYSRRESKDQNASLYVGIGEDGYIDRVSITSSKLGPVVKVKIFRARAPLVGDKYASRYSQKGTISLIVPPKLLPRVAFGPNKGMVADLYVNPHAIPSRMPMGEILEMLMSKAALITGRRVDATAFNKIDVDSAREVLARQWDAYLETHPEERCRSHFKEDGSADDEANQEEDKYRREHFASGYEFMEVPIRVIPPGGVKGDGPKHLVASGRYRLCRKPIYMGPCNTQCLKYQVLDKYQVRSIGALDPTTRQPIGGRAREGGQRFGEMERDALISHGATGIMLERLMHVSDEFECVICIRCGNFAIANMKTGIIKCLLDKTSTEKGSPDKGEFGRITIPYVFKYLCHLLFLSSISVTFSAVPTQTFGTGKNLLEDRYVT